VSLQYVQWIEKATIKSYINISDLYSLQIFLVLLLRYAVIKQKVRVCVSVMCSVSIFHFKTTSFMS